MSEDSRKQNHRNSFDSGKGELEPLSSLLISSFKAYGDSQTDSGGTLPLAADLRLESENVRNNYTLLVGSSRLGHGSDQLGSELMHKFFRALLHQQHIPLHIIFLNSGVTLTSSDSPISRHLVSLKELGCALHVDQTSVETHGVNMKACLATSINSVGLVQLLVESVKVVTLP